MISSSIKIQKPTPLHKGRCIIQNALEHGETDCRPPGWWITKNLLLLRSHYHSSVKVLNLQSELPSALDELHFWWSFEMDSGSGHELLAAAARSRCIWGQLCLHSSSWAPDKYMLIGSTSSMNSYFDSLEYKAVGVGHDTSLGLITEGVCGGCDLVGLSCWSDCQCKLMGTF